MQVQTTAWLTLLTPRALELNQARERLANLQKTWIQTRAVAQLSKAPDAILEQINASLANIDAAQTPLDAQRASLLDLQSRVSEEVSRCGTALSQIAVAQQEEVGGIFARDGLPIWSSDLHAHARAVVPTLIRKIAASCWADLYRYLSEPSKGLLGQAGLFVLLLLILLAVRRQVRHWTGNGQETTSAMAVFERPYAAALIVTMLWASSPHSQTPPAARDLFNILVFLPMLRLLQQVVDPKAVPGVFVLGVLVSFDNLRQAFLAGVPLLEQAVLLLEMFIAMAVGVRSLTVGLFRRESAEPWVVPRLGALRVGVVLVLMVVATSAVAGSFGYMSLARLLASSILMGFALAFGLYALFRVLSGIVAFSFRVWPLRLLRMVQSYRDILERRTCRILLWLTIGVWLSRSLDYVGLLQPAISLGTGIISARLEQGSVSISLGDILAFLLAIWMSYLLSSFIRFILQEDVYPRVHLAHGLSYAISSLLHYAILVLGFMLALGVVGVNLTRVSIMAGALGVGIGFGLQNVVSNFVSGLILLLERPVHVGDTVELGDILGEVRRIGARASTVHTWRGAEIIVPNAQLISGQVINWTLSDRLRRMDLPFGVNYGAEPKRVIELMESVARAHPQVLQHPPPRGLFTGYGDSSINFELWAWTNQFEQWPQIRSDLAVALYDAVRQAGMEFPFPQRVVRLLQDGEPGAAAAPSTGVPVSSQPERPSEEEGFPLRR